METYAEDYMPYEVDFKRVNELIHELGLRAGSMAVSQGIHGHLSQESIDLLRRLVQKIDGLPRGEQATR
jgi:hypothetical protein